MKWKRSAAAAAVSLGLLSIILPGCGGGGSDSGGTLSVDLTDAKPALPEGVKGVVLTIDQVEVHRSGGGWVNLPLDMDPYTVDLLQFHDGTSTALVPATVLDPGTYTQLRLHVTSATLTLADDSHVPMVVPSEKVRTDRNVDLTDGGAVALTVDFDLSQSIVAQGGGGYQLKPVLHLVETASAASLQGDLDAGAFGAATEADVVVTADTDASGDLSAGDEVYTTLSVTKVDDDPSTPFDVFWLVPNQAYTVQIYVGRTETDKGTEIYSEFVKAADLPPGANVILNDEKTIP